LGVDRRAGARLAKKGSEPSERPKGEEIIRKQGKIPCRAKYLKQKNRVDRGVRKGGKNLSGSGTSGRARAGGKTGAEDRGGVSGSLCIPRIGVQTLARGIEERGEKSEHGARIRRIVDYLWEDESRIRPGEGESHGVQRNDG